MEEPMIDGTPFAATAGLAGIGALVAESAALIGAEAAAAGGGKYSFSPDELQSVLTQWQDLHDTVLQAQTASSQQKVNTGGAITAPGNEAASHTMSAAVGTSSAAYTKYLTSMQTYIEGYVTTLQGALKNYNDTEQAAASASHSIHGDL
ncbi:MAG TPA: hypothetical protein VHW44_04350 [Pseudonocardiaceae bacterium]|jgi:hypothetical protein|nr:hypothetical protein [Pseudonocardiaceae bacterium]